MCIKCDMFPVAGYTHGTMTMRSVARHLKDEAAADTLSIAAECLDHWAQVVANDQSDLVIYNTLQAFQYARKVYRAVTGKELPLQ